MKLTLTQETLIKLLKIMKMDLTETTGILLALKTEEQQRKMIYYLKENRHATTEEIIAQVQVILEN